MKTRNIFIAGLMALMAAVSCSKTVTPHAQPQAPEIGSLSIDITLDGEMQTKAAYTTETTAEKKISSIQLLIFHADGSLAYYKNLGTSTSQSNISLTSGSKTVWAVANAGDLSSVKTLSALTATSIELAANNDPSSDFVMAGSNTVTVGSSTSVAITLSRFVSRIVLNKVTNGLPSAAGALTVNYAFLSNVVGNQTLAAGSDAPSTWYNKMGRKDGATSSSQIIDGSTYTATAPALTFKSIGSSVSNSSSLTGVPYLFYSYPNSTSTDANGWSTSFTARKTRLVVAATFGGTKYYYPVTITGPTARNNTYSVEMTITGPGSTDPDKPVEKSSFTATITTQSWQGNTVYTETI